MKVLIFLKIVIAISKNTLTKKYHHMKQLGWQINALKLLNIYLINILSLIDIKYMYERDE